MWSRVLFFSITILAVVSVNAQDCDIKLSGYIYDAGTKEPLEFANVL